MKFTAHATALKRALAFASQVIERRNTIPVLGMVLIECDGQAVTFTGTDLDTECRAGAATIEDGDVFSCLLPPRLLAGLLQWADGTVTISREGDLITITAGDVVATVRELCPVSDWPPFANVDWSHLPVSITETKLRKALSSVSICISTEETRYYLNGVFLHDKGKGLILVATNGHWMGVYETGEGWGLPDAILPRKPAAILLRALPKLSNGSVQVKAVGGASGAPRFEFVGDGWRIRTKTIDGTFPDYKRVIPTGETKFRATISAAALRRFPRPAGHLLHAIKVDPQAGCMSIAEAFPDRVTITMPVQGEGGPIGFNANYLRDFAELGGVIRLESAGASDACRVLTDDPALLQVLMPMRV